MQCNQVVIIVTKLLILCDKIVNRATKCSAFSVKIVNRVTFFSTLWNNSVVPPSNFPAPRKIFQATHESFFSFREKCDSGHNIFKTGTNLSTSPVFLTPLEKNVILATKFWAMWDKRLMQLKKLWPCETNMLFWPQNSQHCEKKFESTQTFYDTVKQCFISPLRNIDTSKQNFNPTHKVFDILKQVCD